MRRKLRMTPLSLVREFLALEAAGGLVMLIAAGLALFVANSSWNEHYEQLRGFALTPHMSLELFVNDVLMTIFFFAVGMELKCEMKEGALSQKGQSTLPLMAALGGVILPALIYLILTRHEPSLQQGWAIPTATDIAFALCALRLIGPQVPQAAKIFLLAIAMYDDLMAILIIGIFYAHAPSVLALGISAGIIAILALLNRFHLSHRLPYLLFGAVLWQSLHGAGIHPTLAGVLTAFAIPMRNKFTRPLLAPFLHHLHPWVAFLILPAFAFINAGVDLRGLSLDQALSPLPVAIALALVIGKQLGIFGAVYLAIRTRRAALPEGVNWPTTYGIAVMAGIGFTMSLFIGNLAFHGASGMDNVKLGVLAGSLISAVWGMIWLRLCRTS